MRTEDIDVDALLAAVGGIAMLFPAIVALVTFGVLRREHLGVRIAGAVLGFVFPPLAIVGWFVYPRVRGSLAGLSARVREAGRQAQAAAQQGIRSGQTQPIDLARLLREAGQKASAGGAPKALQDRLAAATRAVSKPVQAGGHVNAPLDPARLLSSDIAVRFGMQPEGARKLNIPKVVE